MNAPAMYNHWSGHGNCMGALCLCISASNGHISQALLTVSEKTVADGALQVS